MERKLQIPQVWDRLQTITSLQFTAESASPTKTGWTGNGEGTVHVEAEGNTTLLFHEKGTWSGELGREFAFHNLFRWSLDIAEQKLQLEHLRFGPTKPVYLFHLAQVAADTWESTEPHVCRDDLYDATMKLEQDYIELHWTVRGPETNERIAYTYR